eukprot:316300-Prorocentrum_minimum.AAC.3
MSGAVEGMGFGNNTAAMLVTLACREMNQVAKKMGADPSTLSGNRPAPLHPINTPSTPPLHPLRPPCGPLHPQR